MTYGPNLSRRALLQGTIASGLAIVAGVSTLPKRAEAVVLGAGPAGAAAALRLATSQAGLNVTLIERDPARFSTGGLDMAGFTRQNTRLSLQQLKAAGVSILLDTALDVDWTAQRLSLLSGRSIAFDRLYLAPGSAALDENIPGLDARARHMWPAAWGNAREGQRLARSLALMPPAGHVVLRLPRLVSHPEVAARRIGWILQNMPGPAARLSVLDAGSDPTLRDRALAGEIQAQSARLSWHLAGAGGDVRAVDPSRGQIETDAGLIRADVVNFIPQQAAGHIARTSGLTDTSGWCPVDLDGRSTRKACVSVLGDVRKGAQRTAPAAIESGQHALFV